MQGQSPGRGCDACRDCDQGGADGGGAGFGQCGSGDGGCGAGEVERHHCGYQPGGVGVETSRGQVRQGRVFEVGVDLLDDRVAAVGLVGANGVQVAGGEERVETPGAEQGALAVVAAGVEVGDAAHHQPARDLLGGLSGAKRGERDLGPRRVRSIAGHCHVG